MPENHGEIEYRAQRDDQSDAEGGEAVAQDALPHDDAVTAGEEHGEEQHDQRNADKAQLFSHHGHDEIVMRFRQVEHFLHAVAHAQPEKTAAAQRVERLHQLIAGVQRILEGIEEGQQAAHAVWGHHDQHGGGAQSQPECQKEIEKTRSANQAHEEQQRNHDHGSAEVGLKQEQAADNPGHGKGRNDALDEGLTSSCLVLMK